MSGNAFLDIRSKDSSAEDVVDAVYDKYAKKGVISKAELAAVLTDYSSWKGDNTPKYKEETKKKTAKKGGDEEKSPDLDRQSTVFEMDKYAYDVNRTPKELEEEALAYAEEFKKRHKAMKNFANITDPEIINRMPENYIEGSIIKGVVQNKDKEMKQLNLSLKEQYSWDICFVFRIGDAEKEVKIVTEIPNADGDNGPPKQVKETINEYEFTNRETARVIQSLEKAGLHTFCYLSVQDDEIYCLVGADETRLSHEADRIEMEVELDPEGSLELSFEAGMDIAKRTKQGNLPMEVLWHKLFGSFKDFRHMDDPHMHGRHAIYMVHDDSGPYHKGSCFQSVNRLKLTMSIIEAESILGGANLRPRKLLKGKKHPLIAYFCLHQRLEQKKFEYALLRPLKPVFFPPSEEIKDYYGEQVGLYFNFLAHYTRWLIPAGFLGLIFFAYQLGVGGQLGAIVEGLEGFALAMALWATAFLESWKRKTATLRQEFGMTNFDSKETDRPEFKGEWVVSRVTGKLVEDFPVVKKLIRLIAGQSFTIVCVMGLGGILVLMITLRKILVASQGASLGLIFAAMINALAIQASNAFYQPMMRWFNEYENHRTDSVFENLLIFKSSTFKLFNSYNSLLYIAFFKRGDEALGFCKQSYLQTLRKNLQGLTDKEKYLNAFAALSTEGGKAPDIVWDPAWTPEGYTDPRDLAGDELKAALQTCKSALSNAFPRPPECAADTGSCLFNELANDSGDKICRTLQVDPKFTGDCMFELSLQLMIVFGMMIVVNNFLELFVPWLKNKITSSKQGKAVEVPTTKERMVKSQDADEEDAKAAPPPPPPPPPPSDDASSDAEEEKPKKKEKAKKTETKEDTKEVEEEKPKKKEKANKSEEDGDAEGENKKKEGEKKKSSAAKEAQEVAKKEMPEKSVPEIEFELNPYEGTFGDYDELIVQFGFVVLFVVAFPLAPFLAMCNNFVEIWIDGTKLTGHCRRPPPKGAKDIGTWFSVLEFLSWMALITNVGIVVFEIRVTKKSLAGEDYPLAQRLTEFLIFEHVLFGAKALVAYFIPDEPDSVAERKERMTFITDVLIGR